MVAMVAVQSTRSELAREEYSSELAGDSGDTAALLYSRHTQHSAFRNITNMTNLY